MNDVQKQHERKLALASSLTEQEADCWIAVAEAASQFLALPQFTDTDRREAIHAIHQLQDKLMKRPAYRTYLQRANVVHHNR